MADLKFCAHFPFSEEAREWARGQKLALSPDAILSGEARLRAALQSGEILQPASEREDESRAQISAYASSRLILAAWKNRYALSRMAVAESKRADAYLRTAADRKAGYVEALAASLGLVFTPRPAEGEMASAPPVFTIPFWQYLLCTPRDAPYKLANRQLSAGLVSVSDHQRIRMLQEAVRKRLEAPLPDAKSAPPGVAAAIQRLEPLLPRTHLAPTHIEVRDFPPCIKKLVEDLRASVNVPHHGRLALVIYLLKAGLSDEQIISLFTTAPDYNAEVTAYQVSYARQKAYSMASCDTMDGWGLCIASCRCFNPLKYRDAIHGRNARESMRLQLAEQKRTD